MKDAKIIDFNDLEKVSGGEVVANEQKNVHTEPSMTGNDGMGSPVNRFPRIGCPIF